MIKNVIIFATVLSLLSTVACKKQEEFKEQKLDANNLVVTDGSIDLNKVDEAGQMKKIASYPILELMETNFDFGNIKDGDKVEHIYKFKNVGKSDLLIIDAKPTCGCTVPEFTKTPVKPGETGQIKIVFNSTGKKGKQQKYINLITNTEAGNENFSFEATVN